MTGAEEILKDTVLTERRIVHDGVSFRLLEAGAGQPVIFLHGGGSRSDYFRDMLTRLAPFCRAIAFDQRAFAGSEASDDKPVDHDHWASDVIGVADALALEKMILVGWSMGASVAINAAFGWPERVAQLVLMGGPDPERGVDVARLNARMEESARLSPVEARARDATEISRQLGPTARRSGGAVLDRLLDDRAATPPPALARTIVAFATRPDLASRLPAIACPVTLIGGTDDGISTPDVTSRLAAGFHAATIRMIEDCGHYHIAERPDAVAAILSPLVQGKTC
jgi:4,5:9,10-diseco-3-hydroxy-5,9,17-trioxoandrosta-1(10),2-diene-4-oate hydrolase